MTILTDLVYCFIRVHFRPYFSCSEIMLRACLILKMKYATNSNLKEHTYNFVKVSNHWHLKLFSGLVDGSVGSSPCCTAWQPEFDFSNPNRGEREDRCLRVVVCFLPNMYVYVHTSHLFSPLLMQIKWILKVTF